ncbi:MAG: hypothetical protein AAFW46_04745 [Pseudomonadota bacterium]
MSFLDPAIFYIVAFGGGAVLLAAILHILQEAGRRLGGDGPRTARRLSIGLLAWAAMVLVYSRISGPGVEWFWPAVIPPLAIGAAVAFTPSVSALLGVISLPKLIGLQVYRTVGAIFLFAYFFTETAMSREFAVAAGWGDVLTGVLAVPTALAVLFRWPAYRLAVILWCAIGVGDLILAPTMGALYGGPEMDDWPLSLIPLFYGPPLGILLHIWALRALYLQRAATTAPQAATA